MTYFKFILLTMILALLPVVAYAQTDEPLVLTGDNAGQVFVIRTGTMIHIQAPVFDAQLSYDPAMLQLVSYLPPTNSVPGDVGVPANPPAGQPGNPGLPTDTIVIQPGGSSAMPIIPTDPVMGQPGEPVVMPGLPTDTIVIQLDDPVVMPAIPTDPIVGQSDGIVISPPSTQPGSDTAFAITQPGVWDFLAIGAGETLLQLQSVVSPCQENQPCTMSPEISIVFTLIIEGEASWYPDNPSIVEDNIMPLYEGMIGSVIPIERSQMLSLDLTNIIAPTNVTYDPRILRLITNEERWLFEAVESGETRLVIRNGESVLVDIQVIVTDNMVEDPACEVCDMTERIIAQIDTVAVTILPSESTQLSIHVQGGIGNCLLPVQITESHDASTITIEIYVDAPVNVPCPEIWARLDETILVNDSFTGDRVTIRINDYTTTVSIP